MKRLLMTLEILATVVQAQAGPLQITWVWTSPSAAASISSNQTTGVETAGPVVASVYHVPATVTAGVASCPAFSATTWTLVSPAAGIPLTSSAANAGTFADTNVTVGQIYCGAVTEVFAAGGTVSPATSSSPVVVILVGSPAAVTGVAGTVGVN